MKHGGRMRKPPPRIGTIGSLGPGRGHVVINLRQLRDWLEKATLKQHGEISLLHAAYINTACRNERTAQLSQCWAKENPDLPLNDRLNLARGIGAASEARDRAIEKLKLDTKPADLWASAYAAPIPAKTPDTAPNASCTSNSTASASEPQDATDATLGGLNAEGDSDGR